MTRFFRATTTYLHVYCTWCVLHELGMSELDAGLFTQTGCRFIKSVLGTAFPWFLPRSTLHQAAVIASVGATGSPSLLQHLVQDTDAALPSSRVPGTSARTCHYLRLPCHHWASSFSRVFWEGTLVSFPGTCPTAAHLAFKLHWNVLWLFSLFNEPTWGTLNFTSSRRFPRHSHLHRLCGDLQTLFCCCTNPSAKSLITKSVGLPKEILHR